MGDADCHTSDIGHWFAMTGGKPIVGGGAYDAPVRRRRTIARQGDPARRFVGTGYDDETGRVAEIMQNAECRMKGHGTRGNEK